MSKKSFCITIITFLFLLIYASIPAYAYNRTGAINYADTYALTHNSNYKYYDSGDCTNFVSQCLHEGGGFPFIGSILNDHTNDYYWYYSQITSTYSWTAVPNFLNHQLTYNNGTEGTTYYGVQGYSSANDCSFGDILGYDWYGQGITHLSIDVDYGTASDDNNYYGDLVDAHSSDRKHVYWTLQNFNSYKYTTYITSFHIAY